MTLQSLTLDSWNLDIMIFQIFKYILCYYFLLVEASFSSDICIIIMLFILLIRKFWLLKRNFSLNKNATVQSWFSILLICNDCKLYDYLHSVFSVLLIIAFLGFLTLLNIIIFYLLITIFALFIIIEKWHSTYIYVKKGHQTHDIILIFFLTYFFEIVTFCKYNKF